MIQIQIQRAMLCALIFVCSAGIITSPAALAQDEDSVRYTVEISAQPDPVRAGERVAITVRLFAAYDGRVLEVTRGTAEIDIEFAEGAGPMRLRGALGRATMVRIPTTARFSAEITAVIQNPRYARGEMNRITIGILPPG